MIRGDYVDIAPGYSWYGAVVHCGVVLEVKGDMVRIYVHVIPDLPVMEVRKVDCVVIGHHPAYE